jgi:hypothetical protein
VAVLAVIGSSPIDAVHRAIVVAAIEHGLGERGVAREQDSLVSADSGTTDRTHVMPL